jgi:hypothetical protein
MLKHFLFLLSTLDVLAHINFVTRKLKHRSRMDQFALLEVIEINECFTGIKEEDALRLSLQKDQALMDLHHPMVVEHRRVGGTLMTASAHVDVTSFGIRVSIPQRS